MHATTVRTARFIVAMTAALGLTFTLAPATSAAAADGCERAYDDPSCEAQAPDANGNVNDFYRVRYISSPYSDLNNYLTTGPNGIGSQVTLRKGESVVGKRYRSVWVSTDCPVDEYHVSVFTGKQTLRKHHTGQGWKNLTYPGVIKTKLERNCYGSSW